MAKDKMLQQQSWEKKKDKLDKKRENARGSVRTTEKIDKKKHKDELNGKLKELKEGRSQRAAESKVAKLRALISVVVIAAYIAAMAWFLQQDEASDFGNSAIPAVLTALLVLALSSVCFIGESWTTQLAKEEEQKEAANHIKGQLAQKQLEKEREERAKERRLLQQKQFKERMQRRAEEEKNALQQAKELARMLRQRREEREAAAAKEQPRKQKEKSDAGEQDSHGWTPPQREQLRQAVANYPEGWSHARKKRWEMIAAEVDGKDARACEETFARLEAEDRAAAMDAKADGRRKQNEQAPTSTQVNHDFDDWLGECDTSIAEGTLDDSDEEEEEEEEEEEAGAGRERMAVEVEPEHKGTEIRLENIKAMQGCATVQVELLHVQFECIDCHTASRVYLSGADEDSADAKMWCEGCSGLIALRLRPTLVHSYSSRLCYVDCVRCVVTDVLPSVLMSVCESCDAMNVHKKEFIRNQTISGTCFSCHAKYGFGAESIRIEQITPCDKGGHGSSQCSKNKADSDVDPMDEIAEELRYLRKKAKSDPRQQLIRLGSALPQMGACNHFKKSFKWYRFSCCGRAFPCPQCHIDSECPAAALGAMASRMICGKCSMEQSYSPAKPCEKCNFSMQPKGSKHWDDGCGTRNLAVMSTKDAKKFKGGLKQATSKTKTSSNKAARVGVKAKAKREHQQKFGS